MIRSNPTLSCRSALDANPFCKRRANLGFGARLLRSNYYDSNLPPIFQTREAWLLFEVKLDVKLSKLLLGDQRWRVKERIPSGLRFRERDDLADVGLAG